MLKVFKNQEKHIVRKGKAQTLRLLLQELNVKLFFCLDRKSVV